MGGACVGHRGLIMKRGRAPQDGLTPLHAAVFCGQFAVVELLVAKGADKDAPDNVREMRGGGVGRSKGV